MTRPLLTFLYQPDQADRARIRYSPLLPYFERAQGGAELLPFPTSQGSRRRLLRDGPANRILVLPAHLYSEPTLAMMRRSCKGLILDLDDAVFSRPWDTGIARPSKTREARFHMTLEAQDAIVTAGPYLRKYLLSKHNDLFVRLILNPIESEAELSPKAVNGSDFQLLWIGSRSTLGYLEAILPSLNRFAEEHPGTLLTVVSDAFPQAQESLTVENVAWSVEAQALALRNATVGLMPLDEHPWSLGKSGYKVLQYMNAGLAVVSSRFGNGDFLLGKDYPYFADDPEEWLGALERLWAGREQGLEWGRYLMKEASRRCHPKVIAASWMNLVEELDARLAN